MDSIRIYLTFLLAISLFACGGGSDSGSGSEPAVSDIPPGIYSGPSIRTLTFDGEDSTPFETQLTLTVVGSIEGQQQVVIVFRQFSGSSAIVEPNNTFSIPSGTFPVDFGSDSLGLCQITLLYEGTFVTNTVSGTTNGTWDCENLGEITVFESFDLTLEEEAVAAKTRVNELLVPHGLY